MQTLRGVDEPTLVAFAERLGAGLGGGDVVLLVGEMGAGKTTFTRALARGLGVTRPDRVNSPTFNLRVEHPGPRPLVHVDLCRFVELGPADATPLAALEALGLDEIDPRAVLVVEWADAWSHPPAHHLRIAIEVTAADRRDLALQGRGRVVHAAEAALRAV
jgi:tRNA threonylcarbamoyladenosine biosynthesis protein TsaE